ncbi:DNA helicase RecD, partial [Streptomyces seoulensis]
MTTEQTPAGDPEEATSGGTTAAETGAGADRAPSAEAAEGAEAVRETGDGDAGVDAGDAGSGGRTDSDDVAAQLPPAEATEGTPALSEAEAELAAQRVERERIARRKAERQGPLESGAKLSGKAADLLAAVRAVESGEKGGAAAFVEPAPAPRRPAPEPVRRPEPVPAVAAPDAEAVGAV